MDNWLSFPDTVKAMWELVCGILGIILGYFLPIKDMVNFIVFLFLVDVLWLYWLTTATSTPGIAAKSLPPGAGLFGR